MFSAQDSSWSADYETDCSVLSALRWKDF
jgi:hypothetical protein